MFGTLFNDISVVRKNSNDTENKRFLVPISYGPKNSWYNAKEFKASDTISPGEPSVKSILPAITFEMTGMNYAEARKTNTMNIMASNILGDSENKSKMMAPVPYDFTFDLIVYSKYIEDGLQIIEQIIPYFAPSLNVKIKEMEDPLIYNDVQVTLEGVISEDNFEDTLNMGRIISWTFTFRVAANVYPPVDPSKIIRKSIINIDNSAIDPATDLETIQTTAAVDELNDIDNSTTVIIDDTITGGISPAPQGVFSNEFSDEFS